MDVSTRHATNTLKLDPIVQDMHNAVTGIMCNVSFEERRNGEVRDAMFVSVAVPLMNVPGKCGNHVSSLPEFLQHVLIVPGECPEALADRARMQRAVTKHKDSLPLQFRIIQLVSQPSQLPLTQRTIEWHETLQRPQVANI
jgi:hypothetical protein